MEIKSIEKQSDIVTVKMTMPKNCENCTFYSESDNYCLLSSFVLVDVVMEKCKNCRWKCYHNKYCKFSIGDNDIADFCPLRCNNG